jgi:hypothetical protein
VDLEIQHPSLWLLKQQLCISLGTGGLFGAKKGGQFKANMHGLLPAKISGLYQRIFH